MSGPICLNTPHVHTVFWAATLLFLPVFATPLCSHWHSYFLWGWWKGLRSRPHPISRLANIISTVSTLESLRSQINYVTSLSISANNHTLRVVDLEFSALRKDWWRRKRNVAGFTGDGNIGKRMEI